MLKNILNAVKDKVEIVLHSPGKKHILLKKRTLWGCIKHSLVASNYKDT